MISNIFTTVCYIIIVIFPLAKSRKYDLEAESFKLYGEDFSAVLRRFRRTPQYLKILEEKRRYMDVHFQEIAVQVMQHIESQLVQRVADMVGYTTEATTTAVKTLSFNYKIRRNGDGDEDVTTEDPVRKLDNYHMLHRAMGTHDRNQFRDLGFEMAGRTVHLIIKGMGPAGGPLPSHNPAKEEGKADTTTETNPHDHEVHSTLYSTIVPMTATGTNEVYKFKRKQANSFSG